jgi:nucleoporin SEH1
VAYDYYGQRVATCSSDNTIKIFNEHGRKVAEWRAHGGSIWRLSWMHPEFGVALASCSFDRKVCVWEDVADAEEAAAQLDSAAGRVAWTRTAELADARDSVVDVQFAPHHLGVRLASCSMDGFVRIHEAADVLDLSTWERHSDFHAAADTAASKEGAGGAEAGGEGGYAGTSPLCLSWCPSIVENEPMLVVGLSDGSARLWRGHESSWSCVLSLGLGGARCHADCVRSVSWAMDAGRSYQLVATASRDQTVKLWALRRTSVAEEDDAAGAGPEGGGGAGAGGAVSPPADALGDGWSARCCAELPHRSQVWRVSWNATGSMLATSEDDGTVTVYQMDATGGWRFARPVACQ